jgi:O-antigen ligase
MRYPAGAFLLALALSTAFSNRTFNSILAADQYLIGIAFFVVTASLNPGEKNIFKRVLIMMGAAIGVLAIYQYFFGFAHTGAYVSRHNIISSFTLDYLQRKRVFFPFVTPNALAGYLSMIMLLAFGTKGTKWAILPLSIAFCLTQSLGAFVSFLCALGIYFYLSGAVKKRHAGIISAMLILLLTVLILVRTQTHKEQSTPVFSALMRMNYWKDTWRIISSYPITGIGIGNFDLPGSRFAHNSYLQLWAETGILGLASFLWLAVLLLKKSLHNIVQSPDKKEKACVFAALTVFLIHNLFDFTFFLPEVSMLWWGIAGLVFSIGAPRLKAEASSLQQKTHSAK